MAKRAWRYWEPTFQADKVCAMNPVWPWGGHRRFAYDLVRWMRPGRIAELGVHWGTSFFTFAQAMKDGRMKDAELIGVDTFEGEEHAGAYGPEVFETVRGIVREWFPSQSITLHKMLFSEALGLVEDGSVDLLHIDGLHTFEAVREDFETWLPKLAPEGIVLFHDVAPDTGYGSTDYWKQISGEHPGFAFEHSWGLGVLFPKGDSRLRELKRQGLEDKLMAYPALARAERATHEVRDLTRMAQERLDAVQKQGEQLKQLRESTVARDVHERMTARAEAAERMARERFDTIQEQTEMVRRRDEQIASLRTLAQDRLDALRQAENAAAKVEGRAKAAEAARDELRGRVDDLRSRVQDQQERLSGLGEQQEKARERLEAMRQQMDLVRERESKLREAFAAGEARLAEVRAASERGRAALEKSLADMAAHVAALAGSHARDRDATAARLAELAGAIERARQAGERAAQSLGVRLDGLDTDAELQSLRAEHLEEIVAKQREQLARLERGEHAEEDWLTGGRTG